MFYLIGVVTGIISFFVGCIWYTALFGKAWQRLMGFSDEKIKTIFKPQRIIVAVISELVAALCTVGIFYNLPAAIPLIVKAIMLIVIIVGHGVKLAIFDGKKAGVIFINEGFKIITILLFVIAFALFGHLIVF
ncbi:MAG: DUF1761 domain-containing protein [Prevotellaceae bacterium]|jgi:hypothetical protein|nr:DUF1761 domain-containing protein [Prevotellaceae bacterium]